MKERLEWETNRTKDLMALSGELSQKVDELTADLKAKSEMVEWFMKNWPEKPPMYKWEDGKVSVVPDGIEEEQRMLPHSDEITSSGDDGSSVVGADHALARWIVFAAFVLAGVGVLLWLRFGHVHLSQ